MKTCLLVFLYIFYMIGHALTQDSENATIDEAIRQAAVFLRSEFIPGEHEYASTLRDNLRPFSQVQSFSGASNTSAHQFHYPYVVARKALEILQGGQPTTEPPVTQRPTTEPPVTRPPSPTPIPAPTPTPTPTPLAVLAQTEPESVPSRAVRAAFFTLPPCLNLKPDAPLFPCNLFRCPYPSYMCDPAYPYRSFDGSCNNLATPIWGRAFTPFRRDMFPRYDNGIDSFRKSVSAGNPDLPSARAVSVVIAESLVSINPSPTMMGAYQWGQFVDHDLTRTAIATVSSSSGPYSANIQCGKNGCQVTAHPACAPIPIDAADPKFGGIQDCLEFIRSESVLALDCCPGPKQMLNQLTSFIDASNVYGSNITEAKALRKLSPNRGKMRTSKHPSGNVKPYLPHAPAADQTPPKCFDQGVNTNKCFMAGDGRVNEVSSLTMMHTVWVREHNRIEKKLFLQHKNDPGWNGEKLFQETRKIIGAMMQHITYNEFLPLVIGNSLVNKYGLRLKKKKKFFKGYDDTVDPRISNGFSTAAYRFGHSMIPGAFPRANSNSVFTTSVDLTMGFSRPMTLYDLTVGHDGIDGYIRGMCKAPSDDFDRFFVEQVTSRLFTLSPPGGLGTDLFALNLQRGRDHGLPSYNAWRRWCGLPIFNNFADLQAEFGPAIALKFSSVYLHVNDIDLYAGGVVESKVPGGLVGPTFACIIGRQFKRLRVGDRFWFENKGQFTKAQLLEIRKRVTLANVLCQNGDNIVRLQPKAMLTAPSDAFCAALPTAAQKRKNNCLDKCSKVKDINFSKF